MAKIVFIGAGSGVFTRNLTRDLLTFPRLADATITLVDINPERLEIARKAVQFIVDLGNYPAVVEATLNRQEALKDADVVIVTITAQGVDVWRHDIEIPKQFGVDINVGDTRGPAGIFRFLRTIPVMMEIARDMEKICPQAVMLNYTNPMAMICNYLLHQTTLTVTGLCHSVQGTAEMLAGWIGAPMDEITFRCAGINHMAWYLSYEWNGKDAIPHIRKRIIEDPAIYKEEIVRNEMFLNLDYYVTESSGHNSEYNWWFRKRPELIKKYCSDGTGWNPGEYAYIVKETVKVQSNWEGLIAEWFASDESKNLERGHEYAAYIINSLMGGDPFEFNGNVLNRGLVTNLPYESCVEVPVWVDRKGFSPVFVGDLPTQCAMLTNLTATTENLAVEAAYEGDPRKVFQAIAHDPLTSAVLSLAEIREMVNFMFEKNKDYLPLFKVLKV